MLSKAFHSFLLSVITISAIHSGKVVNAQSPLPSCTSLSVASQSDCSTACSNKGETLADFRGVNGVVLECGCSTSKVCEVVYEDVNAPLPSCTSLSVASQSDCSTACFNKGEFSGDFREDNGVVECACSTSKVCEVVYEDVNAPLPSCTSLGVASQFDCNFACIKKGESFASFSDVIDVECACTASKRCGGDDAEDVNAPLPSCTSLSVTSQSDCSTACSNKGETFADFRGVNGVVLECGCSTSKVCGDGDFARSAAGDRTVVVATIMCLSAMTLMV